MTRPRPETASEVARQQAKDLRIISRRGRPKMPEIPEPPAPRRVAAGRITAAQNVTGDIAVTFPAGRFTGLANNQIAVTATLGTFGVNVQLLVTNVTSTGFSVLTYIISTGANTSGLAIHWIATEVG